MASEIRVDKINSLSGVGTVTLSPTGVDISGITTVSTLKVGTGVTASEDGDIFFTGVCTATTFTGSGANLTNLPAANLSGTLPAISAANLTNIPAANVTGTLPAISGANLTNLPAANITGTLPALSAASLTSIPAANIVGVATAGFERTGGFSDLVKIATATWTSAVSSVTIDSLDTTTYKYFIMLWNSVPSDDDRKLQFRWRQSGSDTTASSYDWNFGLTYGSSTSNLAENANVGRITGDMGNQAWEGCQLEFVIYPKSSAEAGYQGNSVFWQGIYHTNATYVRGINGSLFYEGGASHYPDGFKLYMDVGNLATGDYALYGVKR